MKYSRDEAINFIEKRISELKVTLQEWDEEEEGEKKSNEEDLEWMHKFSLCAVERGLVPPHLYLLDGRISAKWGPCLRFPSMAVFRGFSEIEFLSSWFNGVKLEGVNLRYPKETMTIDNVIELIESIPNRIGVRVLRKILGGTND